MRIITRNTIPATQNDADCLFCHSRRVCPFGDRESDLLSWGVSGRKNVDHRFAELNGFLGLKKGDPDGSGRPD